MLMVANLIVVDVRVMASGEVPWTDPESYITEYSLAYTDACESATGQGTWLMMRGGGRHQGLHGNHELRSVHTCVPRTAQKATDNRT